MCGIHLILDKAVALDDGPIQRMLNAGRHRGPDDDRFLQLQLPELPNSQLFLAANRLMITDHTEAASQPFTKKSSASSFLIYNGEIYNYQELKNAQIRAGLSFESSSDTEVLYHHLCSEQSMKRANGMYAFVFVNLHNGIVLGRDPFGMKPLFYFEDDHFLIISSEIQGILASGLVSKDLNPTAVQHYLQYRYAKIPHTFFREIYEFPPGTIESRSLKGVVVNRSTIDWRMKNTEEQASYSKSSVLASALSVEDLLKDSILSQMPEHLECGLFLSGGVDSTLILALLSELGWDNFSTYSIVNEGASSNKFFKDAKYSRLAAAQYRSQHHEVVFDSRILDSYDKFISVLDQPVADSAAILTWKIAQACGKDHFKVMLSGAGADELFAGYNRHRAFQTYLEHKRLLELTRVLGKSAGIFLRNIWPIQGDRLEKFFKSIASSPPETFRNMVSFEDFVTQGEQPLWKHDGNEDAEFHFSKALDHDQRNYLVSDVLAVTDRMSMQSGVEVRMPYLDQTLTQRISSTASLDLISGGSKRALKSILASKGGKLYCNRPKTGFGLPFGSWVDKKSKTMSVLKDPGSLVYHLTPVSEEKVRILISEHSERKKDNTLLLWGLLVLSSWLEKEFR